jgi:hypothetical protein
VRSAAAARRGPSHPHPENSSLRALALGLDALFAALLVGLVLASSVFGQRGGETLADNWVLSGLALGAAATALAGSALALVALVRGSRDTLLVIPLAVGGIVLIFLVGEAIPPYH